MSANLNGIIYYKLDANINGYPGDITKNCGLRGEEIDGNFNFLRGNDIKEFFFDENGVLYLKKFNGEFLSAKPAETPEYDFRYDPDNATLTIITPDGKEIVLDNFKVNTTVYHDATLKGEGRPEHPLKLSSVAKTGTYLPARTFIDTTDGVNTLPTENLEKNVRYVTKEKLSRFGRLYSLSGIARLKKRLNAINSPWRVPTKEDWDQMLNSIDCDKPDHSKETSNEFLGKFAGTDLKSLKYWNEVDGKVLSEDTYGFSVYPVGYADSRGPEYVGGFGKWAAFWTDTEDDKNMDMYVKVFDAQETGVGQNTWGDDCYLSLRLVRPYDSESGYEDAEDIDGYTVNCLHVDGQDLIWTKENINFSHSQYGGIESPEWKVYEEIDDNIYYRYYVNDWNGKSWSKHELKEGESIVLFENNGIEMHEWRIINNELVDTLEWQKAEFAKEFERLDGRIDEANARIDAEIVAREEGDKVLAENIQNVDSKLDAETSDRIESDASLNTKIEEETDARIAADQLLQENIDNETVARETADADLQRQINENKAAPENDSIIIVPGTTVDGNTTSTTIKVNLPENGMIKVDEFGLYFDGNFGTF